MTDDRRKNHAPPARHRLTFPPAHNFYIVTIPTAGHFPRLRLRSGSGSGSGDDFARRPSTAALRQRLRLRLRLRYAYAGGSVRLHSSDLQSIAAAPSASTYTHIGISFSRRAPSSHRARRSGNRASSSSERGGRRPARQPQDGKNRAALLPLSSRPPPAPSLAARMRTLRARPWALR